MKKIIKYLLGLAVLAVVVLAAFAIFIAAVFDPNDYKPQIVQLVKEKKHRDLKLGEIRLAFFPSLGVEIAQMSLSERDGAKEFVAAEHARVSLKLLPLFSKRAVVDAIELKGLRVTLVRFKDGSTSMDDLLGESEPAGAEGGGVAFDIGHIAVGDLNFSYRDEKSGAKYELAHANLKTGRIANGVPSELELGFAVQGNQPKLDLGTQVKSRFTFDLNKQYYSLQGLQLVAKGEAAGVAELVLNVGGNLNFNLQSKEFSATALNATLFGKRGGDSIEAKFDAPRFSVRREQFDGDKAMLHLKLDGGGESVDGNLTLSDLVGSVQSFRAGLVLDLNANLPDAPAVTGDLRGSIAVDRQTENVQASLVGKLMDSQIKAKLGMVGFAQPAFNFNLDLDRLDLDRLLPPKKSAAEKPKDGVEQAIDLSALKGLNASGSIRIGALKASNVQATQIKIELKAAHGTLTVNPLSAALYQGTLNGSAVANAAGPRFAVKQNLNGVNIAPLLKDAVGKDMLEGKGRIVLDVATQGATVSQLKKALNGNLAVNLTDGAIKGINLAAALRSAKAKLGGRGEQTQAANTAEKTDFSEMKASFDIKNGVAHNQDLSLKSPLLRVTGAGDIDLGADSVDYLAKASVVASASGQGGLELAQLKGMTVPVRVVGPYAALQYKIDMGAMVGEAAKQKVEEKKQEIKSKLQEQLKGGLQNLFR